MHFSTQNLWGGKGVFNQIEAAVEFRGIKWIKLGEHYMYLFNEKTFTKTNNIAKQHFSCHFS